MLKLVYCQHIKAEMVYEGCSSRVRCPFGRQKSSKAVRWFRARCGSQGCRGSPGASRTQPYGGAAPPLFDITPQFLFSSILIDPHNLHQRSEYQDGSHVHWPGTLSPFLELDPIETGTCAIWLFPTFSLTHRDTGHSALSCKGQHH
jgi:hypothetical protein